MKKILNRYFWRATSELSIKKNSIQFLWTLTKNCIDKDFQKNFVTAFLFFSIKTGLFRILWISLLISSWFDLNFFSKDSPCNSLQNLIKAITVKWYLISVMKLWNNFYFLDTFFIKLIISPLLTELTSNHCKLFFSKASFDQIL